MSVATPDLHEILMNFNAYMYGTPAIKSRLIDKTEALEKVPS